MADEVIPLFGQAYLYGKPESRVPKKKAAENVSSRSKPVPPSPDLVAAQALAARKCWVCRTFEALPRSKYCKTHNNAYYRWLNCIGEGCEAVGERRIAGQTVYRCPKHAVSLQAEPVKNRVQPPSSSDLHGMQNAHRNNSERLRPSALKRPPYNIGHAY